MVMLIINIDCFISVEAADCPAAVLSRHCKVTVAHYDEDQAFQKPAGMTETKHIMLTTIELTHHTMKPFSLTV